MGYSDAELERAWLHILRDREFRFGFTRWKPNPERAFKEFVIEMYRHLTGRDPFLVEVE